MSSMRLLLALTLGLALANPSQAADPVPKDERVATTILLAILFDAEVQVDGNVNDIPLFELLQQLSKRYNVAFAINLDSFKAEGVVNVSEAKPTVAATQLRGLRMHQFLVLILDSMNATYLVKGDVVEIVTPAYAAKVSKSAIEEDADGRKMLKEPLVSAIVKDKPLNEVVEMLASRYDLSIVLTPQAGDARKAAVSARLLNLPADKALELLALQGDLRVLRKGNAFLITSRDHAKELLSEEMEKERQTIELEKLRAGGRKGSIPAPPKPGLLPKPNSGM